MRQETFSFINLHGNLNDRSLEINRQNNQSHYLKKNDYVLKISSSSFLRYLSVSDTGGNWDPSCEILATWCKKKMTLPAIMTATSRGRHTPESFKSYGK